MENSFNTFDLDPIEFEANLQQTIARYITTATPVSSARAPLLADKIKRELNNKSLVSGPFVENLPDFIKGGTIAELVGDGTLNKEWERLKSSEEGIRLWNLPLHQHQVAAIGRNENYLVATGTGSGKTEAFLIPLIDDLLSNKNLHGSGVRAILIYPLNALANDQMHRIAHLLFMLLKDPGVTLVDSLVK